MTTEQTTNRQDDKTKRELERLAEIEVLLKMSLEATLIRSLNVIFKEIGLSAENNYRLTGNLPHLKHYETEITALLRKHYRKVSKKFKNHFSNRYLVVGKNKEQLNKTISSIIDTTAPERAALIHNTNVSNLNDIENRLFQENIASGKPIDRTKIATNIKRDFINNGRNRSPSIAATETQGMAEATKHAESTVISASASSVEHEIAIETHHYKTWIAILDRRTRPAHARADGERRTVNDYFNVGGEMLRYPGDFNGSAANIINCRCSAMYTFDK